MARRMKRKFHVRCMGGGKGGDNIKALPITINSQKLWGYVKEERLQCKGH